jgi:hypothetical protein
VRAFPLALWKKMPQLRELVFSTQDPTPGNGHGWNTGWKPVPVRLGAYQNREVRVLSGQTFSGP